jgi:hypothetical protein
MLRWLLNTFPSWALMVLVTGGVLALGLGCEWWQRRGRQDREPRTNEMLGVTFEFVGIAYAILIGFVIVSLWESQQTASDKIAAEAAALDDMAVLAHGLSAADRAAVDDGIRRYVEAVAGEEFERMEDGHHSAAADRTEDELLDTVLALHPSTDLQVDLQSKLIDSYNVLTDVRTERLGLAEDKLAGELWILVLASSLAMVLLIAAFETDGKWDVGATAIISVTIGLVLFAMVALSYPFSGQVSVDPSPLQDVVREQIP